MCVDSLGWTSHNTNVACEQLGYSKGVSKILKGATSIKTTNGWFFAAVKCDGKEPRFVCKVLKLRNTNVTLAQMLSLKSAQN